MKWLTKSEEMLLLAIYKLKSEAYGVVIRKHVMEITKENMTYGTLYSYLDQLARKGYVNKWDGEPTPERGGRRKIYYKLTKKGLEALNEARKVNQEIWKDVEDLALD